MNSHCIVLGALAGALIALPASAAPAREAIQRSSGVITVRGEPHTYLTEGSGEPCIVTGLAPQYPPQFSAHLKQRIKFIYVDFKKSWKAPDNYDITSTTMDTLIEEIDDVRKAFGIERACLLGHSSTGLIAIEYAARHPERLSRVILIGVHPFWGQELFDTWTAFWESDASPERKAVLAENKRRMPDSYLETLPAREAFALRYTRTAPRLFYDPSYDVYWLWIGHQYSAAMLDHYWKKIVAEYKPWDRLTANSVPMFIALGRYDYAVPYRLWDRYKDKIPRLTFAMFERSSHFPHMEQTEQFDAALLRWLPRH